MARVLNRERDVAPERGTSEEVTRELEERLDELKRHVRGEDVGMRSQTYQIEVTPTEAARRVSGLSQQEFCARLGISVGTLRNWEQGRREPSGPAKALINLLVKRPELLQVVDAREELR